jgi:hypothetical protein
MAFVGTGERTAIVRNPVMCGMTPCSTGRDARRATSSYNDHTPLPLNLPAVARETVGAAFAGERIVPRSLE